MSSAPQPTTSSNPPGPKSTGSNFRQRLGYYLVGVAIGCIMAGMIYAQRKAARQQQAPPAQPSTAVSPQPTSAPQPASPR